MGYPSVGFEALYRNPSTKVREFLETRHGGKYRLYNLCCEREYSVGELFGKGVEVERFAWADHTPPPAAMILPCMESVDSWLGANPENVVAIHCKAGKGRTGTIIAAYLVHSRISRSADEAMEFFGWRRTKNGKGVTIPSQARFVRQYAFQQTALAYFAGYYSSGNNSSRLSGGRGGAGSSSRALSNAPASENSASGARPSMVHRPATAVIVRSDHDEEERTILTVKLERDSDRGPGFTLTAVPVTPAAADGDAAAAGGTPSTPIAKKDKKGKKGDKVLGGDIRIEISAVDGSFSSSQHLPISSSTAASNTTDNASFSKADASNSIIPVPVASVLRAGDQLLSVNGIELGGRSFPEVISIVRNAADPLTIRVARSHHRAHLTSSSAATDAAGDRGNRVSAALTTEVPSTPLAAGGGNGSSSSSSSSSGGAPINAWPAQASREQYLSRVASAIGPWAGPGLPPGDGSSSAPFRSNPRAVPSPPVAIEGVYLSHVPRLKTKGDSQGNVRSGLCGAAKHPGEEDGPGLYLQLYSGPGCRTLVWDSRYGHSSASSATRSRPLFPTAVNHSSAGAEPAHDLSAGDDYYGSHSAASSSTTPVKSAANRSSVSPGDIELTSSGVPSTPVVTEAATGPHGVRVAWETALHKPLATIGVAWEGDQFFPRATASIGGSSGASKDGGSSSSSSTPVTAAGDFRLVFNIVGRKKPFAALWLNSAFFPLPHAAVPMVRDTMVATATSATSATPSSAAAAAGSPLASAGSGADNYKTRLDLSPSSSAKDVAAVVVPPLRLPASTATENSARSGVVPGTATRSLTVAIPSSPVAGGGADNNGNGDAALPVSPAMLARLPPGSILPARGNVPSSDQSREVLTKTIWLGPDVPGCVVGPSVPLLGALYTASGSYEPHLPIAPGAGSSTAAAAATTDGVVIFKKRHIDGANKDKKHKAFPPTFTIAVRFKALGLPAEYYSALAGGEAGSLSSS
jgi:Protein-tyrosine phosphatase